LDEFKPIIIQNNNYFKQCSRPKIFIWEVNYENRLLKIICLWNINKNASDWSENND